MTKPLTNVMGSLVLAVMVGGWEWEVGVSLICLRKTFYADSGAITLVFNALLII